MNSKDLKDQHIICFAGEDWWFHNPHSNAHIMQEFAKCNRVLFVNSTGIKMPELKAGSFFLKRVLNKLKSFLRYLRQAEPNLYVLTPVAIPLVKGFEKPVSAINKFLLIIQLRTVLFILRFRSPIIWVTAPVARDIALYLNKKQGKGLIYYCCDNLSVFPGVNPDYIIGLERDIKNSACLSLFVNKRLAEERTGPGNNVQVLSHGVDYAHFALAQTQELPIPLDIVSLRRPLIGYVGEIKPLDFELVRFLAQEHPDYSFVFIGDIYAELDRLGLPRNVHFLGKKPYEQLPAYMQTFACCCLYYNVNDAFNMYRNPKKFMEYLATGKPVVSVDITQLREFGEDVAIARNYEHFSALLVKAVREDTPQARAHRIETAFDHTWEAVARRAGSMIMEALP